jgi:GT2 family glycosyltransferase
MQRKLGRAVGKRLKPFAESLRKYVRWNTIKALFDEDWYAASYPDIPRGRKSCWKHYKKFGLWEGRNPNAFFDSEWYLASYPDVAASGIPALIHYVDHGAKELRNPYPNFDARVYVHKYPKGSKNPLLHYLRIGRKRNFIFGEPINREVASDDIYSMIPSFERRMAISIVIPVYKGFKETRHCLESVLADRVRAPDEVIVVDDCSPDREISTWLRSLSETGAIRLIRNELNRGFVASVNIGMQEAGTNDVVLLNSDTIVPPGWLGRLEQQAYGRERVGTVTPLSNNATICSYPNTMGGPLPTGYSIEQIDTAAKIANPGMSIKIPTAVGFAMYIRRQCIEDVGLFDEETFGLGYGEENDFSLRANSRGWLNILACDVFVYHHGEVSFGVNSSRKESAYKKFTTKHPYYEKALQEYVSKNLTAASQFRLSARLFEGGSKNVILLVTHDLGGGTERHVQELIWNYSGVYEFVLLRASGRNCKVTIPSLEGHATLVFDQCDIDQILEVLASLSIKKAHIHHVFGLTLNLRQILKSLDIPFVFTLHDYHVLCPRINLGHPRTGRYCLEAPVAVCNSCIAASPEPQIEAKNIFAHRWKYDWLISEAESVICPSEDSKARLIRYGFDERISVNPHENLPSSEADEPALGVRQTIRVGLIGVLALHKGLDVVKETIMASGKENIEFVLIGKSNPPLKFARRVKYHETGHYREDDLQNMIATHDIDVLWFPAVWPETYSYTLSAALVSRKPIVAVNLGAFPERLKGRKHTCLVSHLADTAEWIASFKEAIRSKDKIQDQDANAIQ